MTLEEGLGPAGASDVSHGGDSGDLFAEEERVPERVVLCSLPERAARSLIEALEVENIGARIGEPTAENEVEVVVHDSNFPVAQAVLVEHTGDVSLVGEIEAGANAEDEDDYVEVSIVKLVDVGHQAARLRDAGIATRLELPDDDVSVLATLLVSRNDLEAAR